MANKVRESSAKTIDVLTETIAREKAGLQAHIVRLRNERFADANVAYRRRPGRLYEVFQAIFD